MTETFNIQDQFARLTARVVRLEAAGLGATGPQSLSGAQTAEQIFNRIVASIQAIPDLEGDSDEEIINSLSEVLCDIQNGEAARTDTFLFPYQTGEAVPF